MKTALLVPLLMVGGVALGGGSGLVAERLLGPSAEVLGHPAEPAEPQEEADYHFVPTGPILAPMVTAEGELTGYARFEAQLEVPADKAEEVAQHLPLLLHAMNMRTYRAPLASGPEGKLPDLELFRRLLAEASVIAFGKGVVRRVAITNIAAT